MNTYLDCVPCFFKQALEASRLAGASEELQKQILDELARMLPDFSLENSPPELGRAIYKFVARATKKADPYFKEKEKSNELALNIYPFLKHKVGSAEDRLFSAVELAIAGNIIDYGVKNSLNVEEELAGILDEEESQVHQTDNRIFDYEGFRNSLSRTKILMYLGDNAGEVVFDRVLIEEIKRSFPDMLIYYAVREAPIINDAVLHDAKKCGIDKEAEIISSGSDAPGTILSLCSADFLNKYKKADMVISKGQGNFEALSGDAHNIYFLFMAKCPVVADHMGCRLRDIVLVSAKAFK